MQLTKFDALAALLAAATGLAMAEDRSRTEIATPLAAAPTVEAMRRPAPRPSTGAARCACR